MVGEKEFPHVLPEIGNIFIVDIAVREICDVRNKPCYTPEPARMGLGRTPLLRIVVFQID